MCSSDCWLSEPNRNPMSQGSLIIRHTALGIPLSTVVCANVAEKYVAPLEDFVKILKRGMSDRRYAHGEWWPTNSYAHH